MSRIFHSPHRRLYTPNSRHLLSIAFCLIFLLIAPVLSEADELAGVSYPAQLSFKEKPFTLNGLGLREATIFRVDVYVAALYLEGTTKNSSATEILDSKNEKILQLSFLREVEVEKIRDAWKVGFESNGSALEGIHPQIASFQNAMRTMKEGETMKMHFSESGVLLRIQNEPEIHFVGADFSRAVLAIWLGPNPPNEGLKLGLLGR